MTITKDELAELLDDVIATIGQILVQHSILREDMLGRDEVAPIRWTGGTGN